MKRKIALILVLIITLTSMVSCKINLGQIIHSFADDTPGYYTYTSFTDEEKALFEEHIGYVIPFVPTDSYKVTSIYDDGDYSEGIRYYSLYNTAEDYNEYLLLLKDFTLIRTDIDEYGDTWYYYSKDNIVVYTAYYQSMSYNIIDVFVYLDEIPLSDSGVLTNDGAGLPKGSDGVYRIDFSKAEHAKNASDLYSYIDSCPTVGTPSVLVIPVQFTDATAASRGYSIDKIKKAMSGKSGETDYYSLEEYYYISSYGKLDLDITVLDFWFTPKQVSSYYKNLTMDIPGGEQEIGEQVILDEALQYLDSKMDLTKFDSDGNGYIDSVIMINTLPVDEDEYFNWAFRFWNMYTDEDDSLNSYDDVSAHDYIWMSYGFFEEGTDRFGMPIYNDSSATNTETVIHEFGHILGSEDYYDTTQRDAFGPLYGHDIMDSEAGDHNPFTKFHFGWIGSSHLVTTNSTLTLNLEDFAKSGETLIIADNWDDSLGAYQEYYVLMYYKSDGLNSGYGGYFDKNGVVIYHVNASLYYETYGDETVYEFNNSNDSDSDDELIKLMGRSTSIISREYVYTAGMSFKLAGYTLNIRMIDDDNATITFSK